MTDELSDADVGLGGELSDADVGLGKSSAIQAFKDWLREHLPKPPLAHSITGQALEDIKNARPAAAALASGEGTPEDAGVMLRNAAIATPAVPRAGMIAARTPLAPRPAIPETPTSGELMTAARTGPAGYKTLEAEGLQQPVLSRIDQNLNITGGPGALKQDITDAINAARLPPEVSAPVIEKLNTLPTRDATVKDLLNLRGNGEYGLRSLGKNEAVDLALPRLEQEIETHAPGAIAKWNAADQNYATSRIADRLDTRLARKERQTTGTLGDRLRAGANEELSQSTSRFLRPEDRAALQAFNAGTGAQDALRAVGKYGGVVPHTIWGGLAMLHNPAWAALPLAGVGARAAYNQSVARAAGTLRNQLLQNSPLYRARLADHQNAMAAWHSNQMAQQEMATAQGMLSQGAQRAVPSLLEQRRQPPLLAPPY